MLTPQTNANDWRTGDDNPEQSPSGGWRKVYRDLGVDPDVAPPATRDPTTARAVRDESRTRRNRRKHARGVA